MTLDPSAAITLQTVETICAIPDDIYRNRWITHAYADLAERLSRLMGGSATWCTFSRWSSQTIGEHLRSDEPVLLLRRLLANRWLWPFYGIARNAQLAIGTRNDRAMPRILALGNHLVFHEIGYAACTFLEWRTNQRVRDDAAWRQFRGSIQPSAATDFFRYCEPDTLRRGFDCYYEASWERDRLRQEQLVLRGNILIGVYEQFRVDTIIGIALDPVASHLVTFHSAHPHDPNRAADPPRVTMRRRGTPWELRHRSPVVQWLAEQYAAGITQWVLTFDACIGGKMVPLRIGEGVPGPEMFGVQPVEVDGDEDLAKLLQIYDCTTRTGEPMTPTDWTRFADRMSFIANLFRAAQRVPSLHEPPSEDDISLVALDLSDAHLDHLRTRGDRPVDDRLAPMAASAGDPRAMVRHLIRHGTNSWPGITVDDALPPWASPELLRVGRDFLVTHGLQIASALFSAALPLSYTASRGARVLEATAQLASGDTARRIAETGQMLVHMMADDPVPLDRGTEGNRALCGVRIFHGAIRQMVLNDAQLQWDVAGLGMPVNQEDLLGTLSVFTVVVLTALEDMGIHVSDEEREGYLHLWLVAGHLLGIDFDALRQGKRDRTRPPLTELEMELVGLAIFRRNAEPSPGGQELAQSLMEVSRRSMPPLLRGLPSASTRRLIGDQRADLVEIPPAGLIGLLFGVMRPLNFLADLAGRNHAVALVYATTTRRLYRGFITRNRGDRPPWQFDAAAEHWGLEAVPTAVVRRLGRTAAPVLAPGVRGARFAARVARLPLQRTVGAISSIRR